MLVKAVDEAVAMEGIDLLSVSEIAATICVISNDLEP